MIYKAEIHEGTLIIKTDLPDGVYEVEVKKPKRTLKQNRSYHLWFKHIAEALNENGPYLTLTIGSKEYPFQWNQDSVKNVFWRSVQSKMFGITSTKELTTKQVGEVAEGVFDVLAKIGVYVDFPHKKQ
jgi:hypothetical protein